MTRESHKEIFEFMQGNSLFHVLIAVCSAEALAFRGVLCGGREESLSVWCIRRSIFHTINLSGWLSMTRAALLNWPQKTKNKTEKQSGMNDIYWYQSSEYNTSWGEVTVIQILREDCSVLQCTELLHISGFSGWRGTGDLKIYQLTQLRSFQRYWTE